MAEEDPAQEIVTKPATALETLEGLLKDQAQIRYAFHNFIIFHSFFPPIFHWLAYINVLSPFGKTQIQLYKKKYNLSQLRFVKRSKIQVNIYIFIYIYY